MSFNRKSFALFSFKPNYLPQDICDQWMINFFPPHFLVSHKIWFDFFFNLGNIFKWNNTFLWNFRVHLTFTNHLIMSHELCNRTSLFPQIKTGSGFLVYFDGCIISANSLENFDCLPVIGFRTYCLLKNIFKKKQKNPP